MLFTVCIISPDGAGKDTVIPVVIQQLKNMSVKTQFVKTTIPVEGFADSSEWRSKLVSAESTNFERFSAALWLYKQNVYVADQNTTGFDIRLCYRGSISMLTYNRVADWPETFQSEQIPRVDLLVYMNAPFEHLTRRIAERGVATDFQDTNLEFRKRVYDQGLEDFNNYTRDYSVKSLLVNNPDGKDIDETAAEISWFIFKNRPGVRSTDV
jgi:thymidylate kinase